MPRRKVRFNTRRPHHPTQPHTTPQNYASLRNVKHFPNFTSLPADDDLDLRYYTKGGLG
ncbi:uncharacterized protein LDX57_009194 [Aspergillus melleus]|uniref:uncharacterized protein n=1 Tax=Aspergillus melleus TaxID=138277 RepID=UPI001E8D39A8|nr:uncharacterized protein LDX57_009194 [Aspergillus melleus]KAH8431532.1 hypothetical protein LDX57_009194 [Aspergillus melleus]